MMKKILTKLGVVLSILALSVFVTACGDGGGDTKTPPAKKEGNTTE